MLTNSAERSHCEPILSGLVKVLLSLRHLLCPCCNVCCSTLTRLVSVGATAPTGMLSKAGIAAAAVVYIKPSDHFIASCVHDLRGKERDGEPCAFVLFYYILFYLNTES